MHKYVLIVLFSLLIQAAIAQNRTVTDKYIDPSLTIQPKVGYSLSKTTFNIAGNEKGTNPNVYSELIWEPNNNIEYGVEATFSSTLYFLKADLLLNNTLSGNVSDIDYDEDNRTAPFSELYLSNHKGNGYSVKFQPGLYLARSSKVDFVTYISFEYSAKRLYLMNGKDWSSSHAEYIKGLKSYYQYKFPNYGLGGQLNLKLSPQWSASFNIEGYIAKYYAYGNWNLITDFEKPISYEHKGNGMRIHSNLGLSYSLSPSTSIGMNYNLNHFGIMNGKDYVYSKSKGVLTTRLNDANEMKHTFLIGIKQNFSLLTH